MSCATKPIVKSLSMATNSCLFSLPSSFSAYPHLSIPSKPFKLNVSCSYSLPSSSLLSLKKKRSHFRTIFTVLASAQQEDDNNNTIVLEEEEEQQEEKENFKWENQESSENEEDGDVIEAFGEGDFVEGVGEDGSEEGEEEGEYQEPPEDAKLFVGNLPYDVDSEKLAHLFEQAGLVEIAEVIYNRETDQSRGFGFVTMSTVEEAEKAVDMFNRYDLSGRLLTVNKAAPRGSRPERTPRVFEPSYRVYVGNLPWDVDDARLEQVFSEHGKVVSARVVYDRETGRSRGFGFVTMSSESELNDAIDNLDGQSLDGRTIRVNVAEERPRRI